MAQTYFYTVPALIVGLYVGLLAIFAGRTRIFSLRGLLCVALGATLGALVAPHIGGGTKVITVISVGGGIGLVYVLLGSGLIAWLWRLIVSHLPSWLIGFFRVSWRILRTLAIVAAIILVVAVVMRFVGFI